MFVSGEFGTMSGQDEYQVATMQFHACSDYYL
jgi:hypothetical protein